MFLTDITASDWKRRSRWSAPAAARSACEGTRYLGLRRGREIRYRDSHSIFFDGCRHEYRRHFSVGTIENLEHRHWKSMVDVNLMGPIHVMETFVPPMIRAGKGGHLVNVSSGCRTFGPAVARRLQCEQVRPSRRVRGAAIRSEAARNRGQSGCTGWGEDAIGGNRGNSGYRQERPAGRKLTHRFEARAVSPEKVASCILRGIEKNTYLVYTSNDIRFGYWWRANSPCLTSS